MSFAYLRFWQNFIKVSLLFLHPGLRPAKAELKPLSVKQFAELGKGTYSHKQRHSLILQTRQLFKLFLEPLNEEFLPAEKRTPSGSALKTDSCARSQATIQT
jgi:hypothetical protein